MEIGMIGLGRMGANMVRRLMKGGHSCVVYDHHAEAIENLVNEGAIGSSSLADVRRETAESARNLADDSCSPG